MSTEKEMPAKLVEDSDWTVAPSGGSGGFCIGYVAEVNGPGAIAVPEFIVSRHELLVLLKYWAEIDVDISFFCFSYETYGSDWSRRKAFAVKRVNRIADALADEESVTKAWHEVYETYGKQYEGLPWKVFSGKATPEEERQFREEQARFLGGDPGARAGEKG